MGKSFLRRKKVQKKSCTFWSIVLLKIGENENIFRKGKRENTPIVQDSVRKSQKMQVFVAYLFAKYIPKIIIR
jgi:hypothetical protein